MSDSATETLTRTVEPAGSEPPEDEPPGAPAPKGRLAGRLSGRLKGTPAFSRNIWTAPVGVWAGLALVALGFGVIIYSWVKVAGMLNVALQMPYVVSGGMTGLALIIIGVAEVDMRVRRQDRVERQQQMAPDAPGAHRVARCRGQGRISREWLPAARPRATPRDLTRPTSTRSPGCSPTNSPRSRAACCSDATGEDVLWDAVPYESPPVHCSR